MIPSDSSFNCLMLTLLAIDKLNLLGNKKSLKIFCFCYAIMNFQFTNKIKINFLYKA